MNYPNLTINTEKCIKCGMCVKDCIAHCLELNQNTNLPQFKQGKEWTCIKCQHCLAVCPTGALEIFNKNPDNSESISPINSEELLNLIKSRRSIRQYKPENLDKERLDKLKNMLKWTPTGVNNHSLHFTFVDDIEVMDNIRTMANKKAEKLLLNPIVQFLVPHFKGMGKAIQEGNDVIFRNAPHMVIVSVPKNAPCKREDPIIALSYFELLAQSMGVGTVWCGFAYYCFKLFPSLAEYIGVPDGNRVGYVMLFGKPDVKYSRTTQPDDVGMNSATIQSEREFPVLTLIKRFLTNILG